MNTTEPFAIVSALPIRLDELIDHIRLASEDETLYIHQVTGQLYTVSLDDVTLLGEMHDDLLSEAEIQVMDELRQVLMSEQWIALPSGVDEAQAIAAFCATLDPGDDRDRLQALQQKSPGLTQGTVNFLDERDLIEAWDRFQAGALAEAIATQLTTHQIPFH